LGAHNPRATGEINVLAHRKLLVAQSKFVPVIEPEQDLV